MTREISNQEDVLDSRDIIERIDELEAELKIDTSPSQYVAVQGNKTQQSLFT